MKKFILAAFSALVFMGDIAVSTQEAGAVVCARGVYRTGCAGPRGAAVVRRPVYPAGAVHVRRRVY